MKRVDWKETAELIGIAALVASLVFVGLQMKQAEDIAMSENDMALLQSQIAIRNALNDHAALWTKAHSPQSLDDTERLVFRNLVTMLNDAALFDFIRADRLGQAEIAQVIVNDFAGFLFEHQAARREWLVREESLIRYRNALAPNGEDFSFWMESVSASIAALEQAGDAQAMVR